MHALETQLLRIDLTEELASGNSSIHRLDARAKIVATFVFVACVASYPRYTVSALAPYALFPMLLAAMAQVPWNYVVQRMLLAAPFVLALGLLNPLIDRTPACWIGSIPVSGGWLSCASIIIRGLLCVSATILLLATTGIYGLCGGLRQMRVPAALVTQILFLYRYLFLLMEEGLRMVRAARVRAPGQRSLPTGSYTHLVGSLLLRAMGRAERVHLAMSCRGYEGRVRVRMTGKWQLRDTIFLAACMAAFVLIRSSDLPAWLGKAILEGAL